jgi:hypothetical protein
MRVVPSVRHCCFYRSRIWSERRVWTKQYRARASTLSLEFDDFYQKIDVTHPECMECRALDGWQMAAWAIAK